MQYHKLFFIASQTFPRVEFVQLESWVQKPLKYTWFWSLTSWVFQRHVIKWNIC